MLEFPLSWSEDVERECELPVRLVVVMTIIFKVNLRLNEPFIQINKNGYYIHPKMEKGW